MKKILVLLTIIFSTISLSSCGNKSEEEKIADDLDLQIQEFSDIDTDSELNKTSEKKDETKTEVKIIKDKKNKDEKIEIEKPKEENNIQIVKTIEEFAKCITRKWAKVYWTSWCWYCQKQKEMFWDALKNISFTDCDENRKVCKDAWITWYPTWIINWKKYPWVQSLEFLWKKTWCGLVK